VAVRRPDLGCKRHAIRGKRQKSRIIRRGGAEKKSAADCALKQCVWPLADRAQGAMFSSSSPASIVALDPPHDESDDIACC
jgi:hypothetical protein